MCPNQDRAEFTKDKRAMKAIRFTAMFATREMDEEAPCVAASRRFLESLYKKNSNPRITKELSADRYHMYGNGQSELIWMETPTLRSLPESKYSPEFCEIMNGICDC